MKEKALIKSLKEVCDAFEHSKSLLDTFDETQLEMQCSLPYSEDEYGMAISEYATYSGDCSRSLSEIVSAMKVDGLLEEWYVLFRETF